MDKTGLKTSGMMETVYPQTQASDRSKTTKTIKRLNSLTETAKESTRVCPVGLTPLTKHQEKKQVFQFVSPQASDVFFERVLEIWDLVLMRSHRKMLQAPRAFNSKFYFRRPKSLSYTQSGGYVSGRRLRIRR